MIACHVLSLHILHFCRHCLRQKYFRKYSMWVKLPATLNIQLEYAFYTWWKVCTKFVGTIIFLSPSNYYSLDAQCCNNDCCECLLVRPRDVNLSQNGDPRVGKLTFETWKCQISRGLPACPWFDLSIKSYFWMVSFLILLRSLRVYILKQLFFSISVNILPLFTSISKNNC